MKFQWLWRVCRMVGVLLTLGVSATFAADQSLYQGPVLDISVQRGEQRLPLAWVDHLQKGDRIWVNAQADSLAKGDWLMLLATISPSGNRVKTVSFDLSREKIEPVIDIGDDQQVPVVVLAPQLRNMFGLYTSYSESADLLREAVKSDPQRFFELQKLDQINQAISALREGLDQVLQNTSAEGAVAATQALAAKFGVKTIDPECFKNNQVNTQCVALSMVSNRDFVVPSNQDLSSMVGAQKAADLTGFLASSLHLFSAAGDFLADKFRDQYDFAPSFARSVGKAQKRQLFSLVRFRNGNVKTAYVYAPAWFVGAMPKVTWSDQSSACLFHGQLKAGLQGHLSVVNYWHDWTMSVLDEQGQAVLTTDDLVFKPDLGRLDLGLQAQKDLHGLAGSMASVQLRAHYAFEPLSWPVFQSALPLAGDLTDSLQGLSTLVSGELASLSWADPISAPCVDQVTLQPPRSPPLAAKTVGPGHWQLDLSATLPGDAQIKIAQFGVPAEVLPVRILNPMAHIKAIVHADLDSHLLVQGEHLERLQKLSWDETNCWPMDKSLKPDMNLQSRSMSCDQDIRLNDKLPDRVLVSYPDNEPLPMLFKLTKSQAAPQLVIPPASSNALLTHPSPMALQWGLGPLDAWLSQDSGLSFLFRAEAGYQLGKGSYRLELKFQDDPLTEQKPIRVALISDPAHNELRTRSPVSFKDRAMPSVINPLEWRVVQETTELAGPWQTVNRSVLVLPELQSLTCANRSNTYWLHGNQLDLIDSVQFDSSDNFEKPEEPALVAPLSSPVLEACSDGLCLRVAGPAKSDHLRVALHWVDERIFHVKMQAPNCPSSSF